MANERVPVREKANLSLEEAAAYFGIGINKLRDMTDDENCPFGQKQIRHVKLSDAKIWFVPLHDRGYKQNTIGVMQCVVRPAFEMAVDDDILRKNPFQFKLSDVVPRDAYVRTALSREQQEQYLQFFMEYGGGSSPERQTSPILSAVPRPRAVFAPFL